MSAVARTGEAEPILESIYAAALDPRQWPGALARAAGELDASSAFFFSAHSAAERTAVCHTHNHAPELTRDFLGRWHSHDVWAQRAPAHGVRPGQVVCGTDLVPERELARTSFYADFLRTHGIERMMGSMLFGPADAQRMPLTHLCWYRPPGAREFEGAARERLARWVPHFRRALRVQRRLSWLPCGPGEAALDAMYVASLLLDADGVIRHSNAPAAALLAALPPGCVRFGRLRSLGLRSSPSLADALAACGPANPVLLSAYLGGERPQVLAATLVHVAAETVPSMEGQGDGDPCHLLLVELPRSNGAQVAASVADLFQLTPAEVRVLGELLQGSAPAGIAQACGTSVATIRTQISSILLKTGTRGQADLLLLLRGMRF